MLDKFLKLIKGSQGLIDEARRDSFEMIIMGKEMFILAVEAVHEETTREVMKTLAGMDKNVNKLEMGVRKKVFSHLAISRGADLLEGLQLNIIITDLERIGDYTKNIGELVEMMPGRMDFGRHDATFRKVKDLALELFDITYKALEEKDEMLANDALRKYDQVSKAVDARIKKVVAGKELSETVEKRHVALVLLLRYTKRICAHLKNINTSLDNPFHQISYRPGAYNI
jgi:phosphate transport system protein